MGIGAIFVDERQRLEGELDASLRGLRRHCGCVDVRCVPPRRRGVLDEVEFGSRRLRYACDAFAYTSDDLYVSRLLESIEVEQSVRTARVLEFIILCSQLGGLRS